MDSLNPMRPVRPRQEVEALKQNILNTALKIITQEGFDSLTMRRLGRELGMTAPNLYNYYRSKDEIYMTLMLQGFMQLKQALMQVVL
ncbi:helix-turn-helix domain-containing protein, partial [Arthrospira platensis SPKY1]|nr:helix-turn-helix domain-containing protein [Arthrospira platensis SPKY1]